MKAFKVFPSFMALLTRRLWSSGPRRRLKEPLKGFSGCFPFLYRIQDNRQRPLRKPFAVKQRPFPRSLQGRK